MADKGKGQVMTPTPIVEQILDIVGYTDDIINKKICEPSFGDGQFLAKIIERLIIAAKSKHIKNADIASTIKQNVFGFEKDKKMFEKAIAKINAICFSYSLPEIDWSENLLCANTLDVYNNYLDCFDFVVGNPPYVRIHNMSEDDRLKIKNFTFNQGMSDLYVIFYEIGIKMLKDNGKLCFISPNSFMKNASQKSFRKYILENNYLEAIYDFREEKVFSNADTYTCICLICNGKKNRGISYYVYIDKKPSLSSRIEDKYILDFFTYNPWNFSNIEGIKVLIKNNNTKKKLGDIAIIQNGVSTNRDSVYCVKCYEDINLTMPFKGSLESVEFLFFKAKNKKIYKIESKILKKCIKGSRCDATIDNSYIIFPYHKNDDKYVVPYTEKKLLKNFPLSYRYLSDFKDDLSQRDMDPNVPWFAFARNQGLQNVLQKKIVFKHVFPKGTKFTPKLIDAEIVVYSGFYIVSKTPENILSIISSDSFANYANLVGKNMSGGYLSISSNMVKNFGVLS